MNEIESNGLLNSWFDTGIFTGDVAHTFKSNLDDGCGFVWLVLRTAKSGKNALLEWPGKRYGYLQC